MADRGVFDSFSRSVLPFEAHLAVGKRHGKSMLNSLKERVLRWCFFFFLRREGCGLIKVLHLEDY